MGGDSDLRFDAIPLEKSHGAGDDKRQHGQQKDHAENDPGCRLDASADRALFRISFVAPLQTGRLAASFGIELDFSSPLGEGTDGIVYRSDRRSAVKALQSEKNYRMEFACYQRLKRNKITETSKCGPVLQHHRW